MTEIQTGPPEPRYGAYPNMEVNRYGEAVGGWDVCDTTDGRVVYRACATQDAAQARADALNAGEPEPVPKRRHRGPNIYPVGWEVWDEGLHFKTVDDVRRYVVRLYSSAWFIRYYGSRLIPSIEKRRGSGGVGRAGAIRIGFKGGYAREGVVLHELTHELLGQSGHPPRFNRVWLELMRHEMGEAMERKLRELYTEHRVRMDSPTKPLATVEYAKARADRRARERLQPKIWRFEVIKDGKKETAAFMTKTLGGAMIQAERQWGFDSLTSLRAWRGRATPAKKPVRKAAMKGRP